MSRLEYFSLLSVTTTFTPLHSANKKPVLAEKKKLKKGEEQRPSSNCAGWMLNVPRAQDKHSACSLTFSGGYANEPHTQTR